MDQRDKFYKTVDQILFKYEVSRLEYWSFYVPYSKEDRVYLLSHLIEEVEKGKVSARLLALPMTEMSEYISITSFGRDGLNIAAYNMPGQDMKTSYISETNLTVAFQDYLIWLEDSDFVFSEEETLVALKKARNTLV